MSWILILWTSLAVMAADGGRPPGTSVEERILNASDEEATALLAEEFQIGKEPVAANNDIAQVVEAKSNLKESQIPVLTEAKKSPDTVAPQPFRTMVLSLGIILGAIFGLGYAGRRWFSRKRANLPNTQIRIITQQYLGPRKSLAIVHVAGESLLLGVTDNQINLLKQLSLIDDELPNELPKSFDETLDYAEETQPEPGERFSMRGLKDVVSNRLKNMREL